MAEVKLTIPTQDVPRVTSALCQSAGLSVSAANAKQALVNHIKQTVRNVERSEADAAVAAAVVEPVEPAIT